MSKNNVSKITNTQIIKSMEQNKKVDPKEIPDILYFGASDKLDHLDTPAFLTLYKGIAQLFSVRKNDLITDDAFKRTIFKYVEWESGSNDNVKNVMKTVKVYHNNDKYKNRKVVKDKVEGYIHYIDVSKIKDQLIEVVGSTVDREVLYIGKNPLPIQKVEKCVSRVVCEYKCPDDTPKRELNDSRVQYESSTIVKAGFAGLIVILLGFIIKLVRNNTRKGVALMDKMIQQGETHIVDAELREMFVELSKNISSPVIFVKGVGSGIEDMTLSRVKQLAGENKLNCANPNTLTDYPADGQVILIDITTFKKKATMEKKEEVEAVFYHELGHVKTWRNFNATQRADYFYKVNIIIEAKKNRPNDHSVAVRAYYVTPLEMAANNVHNVDVEVLCRMTEGEYQKPNNFEQSNYYKFVQSVTPPNILQLLGKSNLTQDEKNTVSEYTEGIYKEYFPHMLKNNVVQESVVIQEATDIPSKRKQIINLIIRTFNTLDPTGINSKKYKEMFSQMSDAQFKKWADDFHSDHKSGYRWDIEEFGDGTRTPKFQNINKAADMLGIKLFEYIYIPHVSSNKDKPVRSRLPVLVGKLPIKRPQQFVAKKTNLSLSDTDRDAMTGVVKGDSKAGTSTGIENELLQGVGGDIILQEIIGARADNQEEYANMIQQIAENGSVNVRDIKTHVYDKGSLLKADLYLMAMGIKTDLISESYYSLERIRAAAHK